MNEWLMVLLEPARVVLSQIGQFLVGMLWVIILLIIGWMISKALQGLTVKLLNTIKVNEISKQIALENLLAKGGIKYSFTELVGVILYWMGMLVTIMVAMNAAGLTIAADLLNKVVLYIPNIIAAIFILVIGMFVATLLRNIIQAAANNAGLYQAKTLSKIVEIIVMVFAVLISLEQLNIGAKIIELTIGITLGSLGLAFAIAVGFGCRDIAEKIINEAAEKLRKK